MKRWPALLALTASAAVAGAPAHIWQTYHNARFGTQIAYPSDVFRSATPSDSGDGTIFHAADGASLAVFGQWITENGTPARYEAFLRQSEPERYRGVTYRFADANALVLSGTFGAQVFYERYAFAAASHAMHAMVLEYPLSQRATYGPLAMRMATSLHGTKPAL